MLSFQIKKYVLLKEYVLTFRTEDSKWQMGTKGILIGWEVEEQLHWSYQRHSLHQHCRCQNQPQYQLHQCLWHSLWVSCLRLARMEEIFKGLLFGVDWDCHTEGAQVLLLYLLKESQGSHCLRGSQSSEERILTNYWDKYKNKQTNK